MTQEDFLLDLARSLEEAGIPFMVAGSHGSSFYGQPRATNDVDLVIDPTPTQLDKLLALLGPRYYVSATAARDALRQHGMFNVLDVAAGWKADVIVRKDRPFSAEEFRRRRTGKVLGHPLPMAAPEDVVLTKLEWDQITPSERQVKDALHIILVQGPRLDRAYLRHWAQALGVTETLEKLLRAADTGPPSPGPVS
jgi:hypothetical protein